MANGRTSDSQFRYQRPAAGIYRVGPAGSKMLYTTIQSAITQAVADGFGLGGTPCTIEIYPGTYVEDVTLVGGIHLRGVASGVRETGAVIITGTATFAPTSLTQAANTVNLDLLTIQPANSAAAAKALVYGGTAPSRINARQCVFQTTNGAFGVTGIVQMTNSNAGSNLRTTDCIITANTSTDTELLQLNSPGLAEFYGGTAGLNNASGATIATGINVVNGQLNIRSQGFASGAFTQMFTISGTGALIQLECTSVQNTQPGGHIFNFTANGTARARRSGVFANNLAGKIGNGVTGTLQIHACEFAGTLAQPFAQIDTGINSNGAGTYNLESDQVYKEFQVGRGVGFQTIQAAITAAAASASGVRKVVKIPPGIYNESLTLAGGVDLVADTLDPATLEASPVTINGLHTLNGTSGASIVNCKGLVFASINANGSPLFTFSGSGAGGGSLHFEKCGLIKIFNGAATLMNVTNQGSPAITLDACAVIFKATTGAAFRLVDATTGFAQLTLINSGPTNATYSPIINIGPFTPGTPSVVTLLDTSSTGSAVRFLGLQIVAETTKLVRSFNGSDSIEFDHCSIKQTVDEGTLLELASGGFNFYFSENTIDQLVAPSPNGLPSLVQDNGTKASATVTVAANPAPGDTLNINGAVLVAGTDFTIGATTADTADNIKHAINSSLYTGFQPNGAKGILAIIYATAAADVVTVKSFGGAAGNAYTLETSVPLVLVLSGATLAGGVDGNGGEVLMGVNSIQGQAGANPTATGGAVIALPVSARQYYSSQINQPAGAASQANTGEFIVGTAQGQYTTIQAALDAANAVGVTPYRKVVLVSPGSTYAEDLTLYDNVDLVARTYDVVGISNAPVVINGNHSYTPATAATIVIKGILFFNTSGSFEIGASAFPGTIEFHGCSLIKQVNEANPMFLISNVNGSNFMFYGSTVGHVTDSGATFSIAGGSNLRWLGGASDANNHDLSLSPAILSHSAAVLVDLGANSRAYITKSIISVNTSTCFQLDASFMQVLHSTIEQFADTGQLVKFNGVNGQAQFQHDEINLNPGDGNSNLIARNGTQASGTITAATNPTGGNTASGGFIVNAASTPGDTVTVDGVVLTAVVGAPAGPQFQIDADPAIQAANIAAAIVANVPPVSATSSGPVVAGVARASGVAGNAINLLSSNAVAITAPSPTMTGGTDGDTVTINGVVFMATVDPAYQPNNEFRVGGTTTITATNLAAAVNASGSADLYARSAVDVVTITARKSGTAGNAFTLASSAPLVLVLSGATLAGGVDGGFSVFVYSQIGFQQERDIESSVIPVLEASLLVSV